MRCSTVKLVTLGLCCGSLGCGDGVSPEGPDPIITSVSPAVGTVGTELTIRGANFRAAATVLLGSLVATGVEVTDTVIFASVPSGVKADSTYAVTARNRDETEATLPGAFKAVAPVLQFVNSATKPSGNTGSTVIVEGNAFGDGQGEGQVLFSNGSGGTIAATIAAAADWTNTFIVTTVPSGTASGPIVVKTGTGTSSALTFTVTQNATFSPSAINWQTTTDLPVAVSGHDALFVPIDNASNQTVQYVYLSGGASNDSVPRTAVSVVTIQGSGTLGNWTTTLTALSAGRAFHRSVAATPFNAKVKGSGYLYVLGGIEAKGGAPVTTVYRAQLNNDGTIGAWSAMTPLPAALHSLGAVVFRSAIYVAGGATTGNAPAATVYRARIDTLGALGSWETMSALPAARAYHGFATFGGYLYAVGGETGTVNPDDGNYTSNTTKLDQIVYSKIDLRTGTLGAWTVNASALQKARSKHSALVAGGSVFVSAGLYAAAGTGSSENSFATINSDGTVGTSGGATGSNTLQSVGGANLFNHAAIVYQDAQGVAHVMILGGDDVNAPGSKRKKVMFY